MAGQDLPREIYKSVFNLTGGMNYLQVEAINPKMIVVLPDDTQDTLARPLQAPLLLLMVGRANGPVTFSYYPLTETHLHQNHLSLLLPFALHLLPFLCFPDKTHEIQTYFYFEKSLSLYFEFRIFSRVVVIIDASKQC